MRLLAWSKSYTTGIDEIDADHRRLITVINRLHDDLDRPGSGRTVRGFLGDMIIEFAAHFAEEERYMRGVGDPHFEAHKADHDRLLGEMQDVMDAYEYAVEIDSVELAMRLDAWFARHFKSHDAHLHHAPAPEHSAIAPG